MPGEEIGLGWLIRYLTYAPARQLLRECAVCAVEAFGPGAERHLRAEIEPGTPP